MGAQSDFVDTVGSAEISELAALEDKANRRTWKRSDVARMLTRRNALTTLTEADAMAVVGVMKPLRVLGGTVLFQAGATDTAHMLVVLSGTAIVERPVRIVDETVKLATIGPGEVLGEMGLFDGTGRSATCTAITEMELAILSRHGLSRLIKAQPTTACALMSALLSQASQRLRTANQQVQVLMGVNQTLRKALEEVQGPLDSRFG